MRSPENVARLAELQQREDDATKQTVREPEEIVEDLKSLEEPFDPGTVQDRLQELATALSGADTLTVAVSRESALQALKGKVQAPAKMIDAALALQSAKESDTGRSGHAVEFSDPEPWPESVCGAELLQELVDLFDRHVVLASGASEALAIWTLHTYLLDSAWITPRLAVTSPVKRCGKTLVLSLLEELVCRPLMISNVTAAAVFRCIDKYRPTLLVDEADTFLGKKDELRGVLNSGHHRRGRVLGRFCEVVASGSRPSSRNRLLRGWRNDRRFGRLCRRGQGSRRAIGGPARSLRCKARLRNREAGSISCSIRSFGSFGSR